MIGASFRPAHRTAVCVDCGTGARPVVNIGTDEGFSDRYDLCILCLAVAIDQVTGWKFEANVLASLNLSSAAERFRHPERFAARKAGRPRKRATGGQE